MIQHRHISDYGPALALSGLEIDHRPISLDNTDNQWISAGVFTPLAAAADYVAHELYAGRIKRRVEDPSENKLIKVSLIVPRDKPVPEAGVFISDRFGPLARYSNGRPRHDWTGTPFFIGVRQRTMSKSLQAILKGLIDEATARARQHYCDYVRFEYIAHCHKLSNHAQLALESAARKLAAQQTAMT